MKAKPFFSLDSLVIGEAPLENYGFANLGVYFIITMKGNEDNT
jgi:hypothetical protein